MKFDIDTFKFENTIRIGKKKEDDTYYFTPITYTSKQSEKWYTCSKKVLVSYDRYTVSGNMLECLKQDLQELPRTRTVTMKWRVEPNKGRLRGVCL